MLFKKDSQYYKFCAYGFFKNLRFFDAFLLLFFIEKGLTYPQIGVLYAFREVVINVFEILSGVIADIFGRKKAMVASFAMYILSFVLFYCFHHFYGFLIAFLFFGLADSFQTGTHKAMILAYLKRNKWHEAKTIYYGRTRSWSQRGAALSALISALVVFFTGSYSVVFIMAIVPYFIDLILLSTYPSYLNGDINGNITEVVSLLKTYMRQLTKALKQKAAITNIMLTSNFTGYYKASRDYLQVLVAHTALAFPMFQSVDEKQNAAVYIGLAYFVLYLISSLVARKAYLIEGWIKDTEKSLRWTQYAGWLCGLLAGVCHVNEYYSVAIVLFSLIFVVQNMRRPIAVKYVSNLFDENIMAGVLSVESQSETFWAALVALALGFLVEFYGLGWGIGILSVLIICLSVAMGVLNKLRIKNKE